MIDKQAIIEEVARKHKILLGSDDPILTTVAIHDVVIAEYIDQINRSIENLKSELEVINYRHLKNSKAIAKDIIGQASEIAAEQIIKAIKPVSDDLEAKITQFLRFQEQQITSRTSTFRNIFFWIAIVSVVACCGAVAAIFYF